MLGLIGAFCRTRYAHLYNLRLLQSSPNKILQQAAADVLPEISVAALLEAEGERDTLMVGCTTEHAHLRR